MATVSNDEKKENEDCFLAIIFLTRSDFNRFISLTTDLLRKDIQGTDKYPTTVAKVYQLLQEYDASGLAKTHT